MMVSVVNPNLINLNVELDKGIRKSREEDANRGKILYFHDK